MTNLTKQQDHIGEVIHDTVRMFQDALDSLANNTTNRLALKGAVTEYLKALIEDEVIFDDIVVCDDSNNEDHLNAPLTVEYFYTFDNKDWHGGVVGADDVVSRFDLEMRMEEFKQEDYDEQ